MFHQCFSSKSCSLPQSKAVNKGLRRWVWCGGLFKEDFTGKEKSRVVCLKKIKYNWFVHWFICPIYTACINERGWLTLKYTITLKINLSTENEKQKRCTSCT